MATELKSENGNGQSDKLLYDIKESSARLSIAPITVRRLLARGHIHRQPNVRKVLISGAELERFATAS